MANHEMEGPYFGFAVYNMYFHWTVEDNIDEVYPERRSIFQKIKAFMFRTK
jgi:hypothetical protein